MLDWVQHLMPLEETPVLPFREDGLPDGTCTLHEGIGFVREDAATMAFNMPNTLSAGRHTGNCSDAA